VTSVDARDSVLLVGVSDLTCAIPLTSVSETMRALPCSTLAGVPSYVRGASIIRGAPLPVVDLAVLLGRSALESPGRYVVLRGSSPVALAVSDVLGLRALSRLSLAEVPRLLRDVGKQHVGSLAALDAELVPVLTETIVLPDEVLRATAGGAHQRGHE
jgi:purine-binding chemotaxis protein CheW